MLLLLYTLGRHQTGRRMWLGAALLVCALWVAIPFSAEGAQADDLIWTLLYDALRAGASGFLLRGRARREARRGHPRGGGGRGPARPDRDPPPDRRVRARAPPRAPRRRAALDDLTPRELEVFKLLARGMSNAEIAEELVVSDTTVKTHVARILTKLSLRDRVEAVVAAYECGLVSPGRA
jgi:RNA polymerase sigma factor (sigma-70 family)